MDKVIELAAYMMILIVGSIWLTQNVSVINLVHYANFG